MSEIMEQRHPNYYPTYSRPERVADAVVHAVGIFGAIVASAFLLLLALANASSASVAAVGIYCFAIVFSLVASALYHFSPSEGLRATFRKYDHAAIFLKIAGTYTPLVVLIGSGFSYAVLALVWAIALGGMIWKIVFWSEPGWWSTLMYLTLGWLSLALAWPFVQVMPTISTGLVAAGGLTYTIGVAFYKWDSLRFSVAIWHGFVVAASACFYAAIYVAQVS